MKSSNMRRDFLRISAPIGGAFVLSSSGTVTNTAEPKGQSSSRKNEDEKLAK